MTPRYTQDNQCPLCGDVLLHDSNGRDYCECWNEDEDDDWFDEELARQDHENQIPQLPEYDSEF
jgi:hypothetical protein